MEHKQTISELAAYYQVSASTIKRRLSEVQQVWEQPLLEQAGFVHIDATYWGRGAGILLAIDHHTARPLYLEFIRNECAQDYRRALESISRRGYIIRGVVVDGTRTLFSLSLNIPVQMCQYHMRQIISRHLTKRPKLLASRDLLLLIDSLSNQTCEGFNQAFQAWKSKWHDTIMRRSLLKSGKSRYRHRKLRSAIHSIEFYLPYLFTYQQAQCIGMPNTNNKIEGTFSALKRKINCHSGMSAANRQRLICGFFLAWKASLCNVKQEP